MFLNSLSVQHQKTANKISLSWGRIYQTRGIKNKFKRMKLCSVFFFGSLYEVATDCLPYFMKLFDRTNHSVEVEHLRFLLLDLRELKKLKIYYPYFLLHRKQLWSILRVSKKITFTSSKSNVTSWIIATHSVIDFMYEIFILHFSRIDYSKTIWHVL